MPKDVLRDLQKTRVMGEMLRIHLEGEPVDLGIAESEPEVLVERPDDRDGHRGGSRRLEDDHLQQLPFEGRAV